MQPDAVVTPGAARVLAAARAAAVPPRLRSVSDRALRQPPSDFKGLLRLFDRRTSCLSRQLRHAAAYLIAHPDEVAFAPLVTIGKHAGVSPSCIVRLSQRLGFAGFSQMQLLFPQRLLMSPEVSQDRHPPPDDVLHSIIQATERTLRRLDCETSRDMLDRAVQAFAKAHTTFIVARPCCDSLVRFAGHTLTSAGLRIVVLKSFAPDGTAFGSATSADACLVFDIESDGQATRAAVESLAERAVPAIVVTDRQSSVGTSAGPMWFKVDEAAPPDLLSTDAVCLLLTLARMIGDRRSRATPRGRVMPVAVLS